jgi:hypothetical protein
MSYIHLTAIIYTHSTANSLTKKPNTNLVQHFLHTKTSWFGYHKIKQHTGIQMVQQMATNISFYLDRLENWTYTKIYKTLSSWPCRLRHFYIICMWKGTSISSNKIVCSHLEKMQWSICHSQATCMPQYSGQYVTQSRLLCHSLVADMPVKWLISHSRVADMPVKWLTWCSLCHSLVADMLQSSDWYAAV